MFEYGIKMAGKCAKLEAAGAHGKWSSNIQRDMLRASSTGDDVSCYPIIIRERERELLTNTAV